MSGISRLKFSVLICMGDSGYSPYTSIVSDIPGTTRDRVQQVVLLDGVELQMIDTAGIRESEDEEVTSEHIRQSMLAFDQVLGRVTADDVLGVIFSQFCVGK